MAVSEAPARSASRVGAVPAALVVVFSLATGLIYRASVSLISSRPAEDAFVLACAALLLVLAVLLKRREAWQRYWQIPFAFFIFYLAGFLGDGNISPLQHWFISSVLHEGTSANNPLASTVSGSVLAQLFGTVMLVLPIVLLTRASGTGLDSIFIARPRRWWPIGVGVVAFLGFFFLALRGRTESFFPIHGTLTAARFSALAPALIALVLLNGLREELFFRGLFLNKYGQFLGPFVANLLAAVIFTSFHVEVKYAASVAIFLVYTLIIGLIAGWLMQRSQSLLSSVIFHAGTDIPIFLVYLSYASM